VSIKYFIDSATLFRPTFIKAAQNALASLEMLLMQNAQAEMKWQICRQCLPPSVVKAAFWGVPESGLLPNPNNSKTLIKWGRAL
jgi:hypothetical protein